MLVDVRDRVSLRTRLDRAWRRFVDGESTDEVRPEIARSWQRARELYRVDPGLRRAPVSSADELARRLREDETFAIAAPVLGAFVGAVRDDGRLIAFVDAEGWVLSVAGEERVVAAAAEVGFAPGARWREVETATTAAGVVLHEGSAVEVFASEHWVQAWHDFACAAAPVSAGEAEVSGVVVVGGRWDAPRAGSLVAAVAVAGMVGERLRGVREVRDGVARWALREARDSGDALLAVDARGRLVDANEAARRRLQLGGEGLPPPARAGLAALLGGEPARGGHELAAHLPARRGEDEHVVVVPVRSRGRVLGAVIRALPGAARHLGDEGRSRGAGGARYGFEHILGHSAPMARALELALIAARNDLPVVLQGESGTGKELFAHSIHSAGPRVHGPFVPVNCGAIPEPLVEAELFGYEAGTFTGGQRGGKPGKLEQAHGGTLFLDEVSELSGQSQAALLRVLQELEVVRLGGSVPRRVDVRVIAATNRHLEAEVAAGRFRRDLFYRLHVLGVEIPPLRDRLDDLPSLADSFLREAEARVGRRELSLSEEAMAALGAHRWPGNVRELRNVLLRAAAVAPEPRIGASDLLLVELQEPAPDGHGPLEPRVAGSERGTAERRPPGDPGADAERDELVAALEACGWNVARAASSLGVSRMTLYRRLRKHGITR